MSSPLPPDDYQQIKGFFDAFYDTYKCDVLRYALAVWGQGVSGGVDAKDIVQDAWTRFGVRLVADRENYVYLRAGELPEDRTKRLRNLIFTIVRQIAINARRKAQKETAGEGESESIPAGKTVYQPVDVGASQAIECQEIREEIFFFAATLDSVSRVIINVFEDGYGGASRREILLEVNKLLPSTERISIHQLLYRIKHLQEMARKNPILQSFFRRTYER